MILGLTVEIERTLKTLKRVDNTSRVNTKSVVAIFLGLLFAKPFFDAMSVTPLAYMLFLSQLFIVEQFAFPFPGTRDWSWVWRPTRNPRLGFIAGAVLPFPAIALLGYACWMKLSKRERAILNDPRTPLLRALEATAIKRTKLYLAYSKLEALHKVGQCEAAAHTNAHDAYFDGLKAFEKDRDDVQGSLESAALGTVSLYMPAMIAAADDAAAETRASAEHLAHEVATARELGQL